MSHTQNTSKFRDVQRDHYIKRVQLWNSKEQEFQPWDPIEDPPSSQDPYFSVNIQYRMKHLQPDITISDFSEVLVRFLRQSIGKPFFSNQPTYGLQKFFPLINTLKKDLENVRAAISITPKSKKITRAIALGIVNGGCKDDPTDQIDQTIEHAEIFLGYLEEECQPITEWLSFETDKDCISFDLLIYLFKPDDVLYAYDETCGKPYAFVIKKRYYEDHDHGLRLSGDCFRVDAERYFWNGKSFTNSQRTFSVSSFPDTVPLSDLPFHHVDKQIKNDLIARGRKYVSLAGVHHKLYRGDKIMIDKAAYDNQIVETKNQQTPGADDPRLRFPLGQQNNSWSNKTRSSNDILQISDEKLHLLPPELYGFNLATKTWTSFLIDEIGPINFNNDAWESLVLHPNVKTLIKDLVTVTKTEKNSGKMITDVISGKGRGLIAVLHGPPGTGKTLTAEAIAEMLQRPLYAVGSAELSTNPLLFDQSLKRTLKIASAWDAVLLIDEADVFLEERSPNEVERNALVSIALRALEYNTGILFLTTNRIKTFDKAFMSRFSIAINYPELDHNGRSAVWSRFFEMAGCQFVNNIEADGDILWSELNELAKKPFDGRTIKNMVRTAQALALSWNEPLSIKHVQHVLDVQVDFMWDTTLPSTDRKRKGLEESFTFGCGPAEKKTRLMNE